MTPKLIKMTVLGLIRSSSDSNLMILSVYALFDIGAGWVLTLSNYVSLESSTKNNPTLKIHTECLVRFRFV